MNWFRKILQNYCCDHDWKFVANIYGDQINYCGGKRSIWKCKKCGKIKYRDDLYYDENQSYKLCTELDKLYDECYDKRYKEWQLLRSETLNKMQADMRNLAFNGQCWYDIVLVCEEIHNDRNYYEKWFTENKLKFEKKLIDSAELATDINRIEFHIRWKYKY